MQVNAINLNGNKACLLHEDARQAACRSVINVELTRGLWQCRSFHASLRYAPRLAMK